MELLKAVNTILPYLGEHVITRIETTRHPTVDLIVSAINRSRQELLAVGWWFNESHIVLPVNTDGMIDTPTGTLAIYGEDCNVSTEGTRLFNLTTNSRYFDAPIKVKIIREVDFEDLPHLAATTVMYSALMEVYVSDFGVDATIQAIQAKYKGNYDMMNQENLRNRNYNSLRNIGVHSRNFMYQRRRGILY